MPAGRPTQGVEHVEKLEGEGEEKRRLKLILEVIAGGRSVVSACEELKVSEARFHELRRQALQSALDSLTPARAGRPARAEAESTPSRVKELEEQVKELKIELEAARVRTEIALVMPHLLKDRGKKNEARGKRRR